MFVRAFVVAVAAFSSGCASLTHFKEDLGDPKTGVSVDIKQRMVLRNTNKSDTKDWDRICAEPSPDAVSSLGASIGVSLLRPAGSTAQVGAALNEAAAYSGLRTQSIQLMRDAMYRACEAYMGGAIDKPEYLHLQRRFQAQVVGLLAIEQLTGAVAAPPVAVYTNAAAAAGGGASAEADRLAEARKQLAGQKVKEDAARQGVDAAKAKVAKAEPAATKARPKPAADRTPDEQKAVTDEDAAKNELTAAEGQLKLDGELSKLYADALKVAEEDYNNAKNRVRASNTAGAIVPTVVSSRAVSDASMATVAAGVVRIVDSILNGAFNDANSRCLNKLIDSAADARPSLLEVCLALAEREVAAAKAQEQRLSEVAAAEAIKADAGGAVKPEGTPEKAPTKGNEKPAKPASGQPPKATSSLSEYPAGKAEALARANSQVFRAQAATELNRSTLEALRRASGKPGTAVVPPTTNPAPSAPASAASTPAPASGAGPTAKP